MKVAIEECGARGLPLLSEYCQNEGLQQYDDRFAPAGLWAGKRGPHATRGRLASAEQRAVILPSLGGIQPRSLVQMGGPPSHDPHPRCVQELGTQPGRAE